MTAFEDRLGTDLVLLRNRREQNDRDVGRDLATTADATRGSDLAALAGVENVTQALLLRFLTAEGELARLGHPEYGSRLAELIGEPNTETNRQLAKLHVLRAVGREPRVEKVLSVSVTQGRADRGRVDIALSLQIIDADRPLNLVFPFSFDPPAEGGAAP
ncbi:MAG: GPW/gp25 family protein [Pseudomonadota bacterium]